MFSKNWLSVSGGTYPRFSKTNLISSYSFYKVRCKNRTHYNLHKPQNSGSIGKYVSVRSAVSASRRPLKECRFACLRGANITIYRPCLTRLMKSVSSARVRQRNDLQDSRGRECQMFHVFPLLRRRQRPTLRVSATFVSFLISLPTAQYADRW